MTARALDQIGQRYGKLPHELMDCGAFDLAVDYEVMVKATAK